MKENFRQFLDRVFPEGEYKLRRAGPEHPLWRIDRLVRPDSPYVGRLWTVEYGCRTCVVFSEVDLSCYWELSGQGPTDALPENVRQRVDDAVAIGLNVLAYATNREPKGKEQSFVSLDGANVDPLAARRLQAMLQVLPVPARAVVLLRYQEDLDPPDIATLLDMPLNTVKSHLRRSLDALRALHGGHPDEY